MSPVTGIDLLTTKLSKNKSRFGEKSDKYYVNGQLKKAAIFTLTGNLNEYPFDWGTWYRNNCLLETDQIEVMVNACALLIAEIDRLLKNENI